MKSINENGKKALSIILENYSPNVEFNSRDSGIHSATLNSLANSYYLIKVDNCSPKRYYYNGTLKEKWDKMNTPFPSYKSYSLEEYGKEKRMSYDELIKYLKNKYGDVKYDYFSNFDTLAKDTGNGRGKEGLYIHHIMEKWFTDLTKNSPWNREEFHYADKLVYCNVYEHLLLHMKICLEWKEDDLVADENGFVQLVGIGGVLNFIAPIIYKKSAPPTVNITFLDEFDIKTELNDFQYQIDKSEFGDFFSISLRYLDFVQYVKNSDNSLDYSLAG